MLPVWYDIKPHLDYIAQERQAMEESLAWHRKDPASRMPVRAMALSLQSLYNGFEYIMKKICQEIDGHVPRGDTWHADLVNRMGVATENRPPVFSEELLKELHAMRALRHRIVHAYSFFLDPDTLAAASERAMKLSERFSTEVTTFFQVLSK